MSQHKLDFRRQGRRDVTQCRPISMPACAIATQGTRHGLSDARTQQKRWLVRGLHFCSLPLGKSSSQETSAIGFGQERIVHSSMRTVSCQACSQHSARVTAHQQGCAMLGPFSTGASRYGTCSYVLARRFTSSVETVRHTRTCP